MKFAGYELDLNSAGLSKQYCQEPYPPFALSIIVKLLNYHMYLVQMHIAQKIYINTIMLYYQYK